MPHPESAWRAEIEAHRTRACDFAELASQLPELASWRSLIIAEPDLKESLEAWEGYIQACRIAVLIEQASEDGVLAPSESEMASRLEGAPTEFMKPFLRFARTAPDPVRDHLVLASSSLVQIERERRTGEPQWRTESPSGSPEVLRELMFKWGARFRRHRWTW